MTRAKKPKTIADFAVRITAAGGEILGATNPYELLRFRTSLGVGVIYTGKRGEKWNAEAIAVRDHLDAGKCSLAPVQIRGRRTGKDTVNALLKRDGESCFFCGVALDSDITVEHLVPVSHGGPNLACWCPVDRHCHADVLLKLANTVAAIDTPRKGGDE